MGKQGETLVDDPDPAALGGQLANLLAVDEDLPRLGREFAEDASEEGGLPAARGTQNRSQFAVLQSERYVLQNPVAVDGLLEPSDLEGRHSSGQKGVGVEIRAESGPGTSRVDVGSTDRWHGLPGHGS